MKASSVQEAILYGISTFAFSCLRHTMIALSNHRLEEPLAEHDLLLQQWETF